MRLDTFDNLSKAQFHFQWIVHELISPGGWTFLVGQAKAGKSTLIIQLCEALQHGKPFLGMETTQQNCLYIQADAGLMEWQVQMDRYGNKSKAWTAHQLKKGFLDKEAERHRLHDLVWGTYPEDSKVYEVLKGVPFTFVIFDCLHAITNEDINTPSAASRVLAWLDEIVTRPGEHEDADLNRVHYLLIHHPNNTQKRGITAGSGHKSFSALCTTKLTLLGDNERGTGLFILEGSKLVGRKEIELSRSDNGAWRVSAEGEEFNELL